MKLQAQFKKDYEEVKKAADDLDLKKIIDMQNAVVKAGLEMSQLRKKDSTDEYMKVADRVTN